MLWERGALQFPELSPVDPVFVPKWKRAMYRYQEQEECKHSGKEGTCGNQRKGEGEGTVLGLLSKFWFHIQVPPLGPRVQFCRDCLTTQNLSFSICGNVIESRFFS